MIPLREAENSVGLLGDTEGNQPWVLDRIERFAEAGIHTVLHLGDFELGRGNERAAKGRLLQTSKWLAAHDQTWLVTPGNHENWDRIGAKHPGDDGLLWFADRIAFIPRGHRWNWRDIHFVSLGGSPSLNASDLTEGRDWWPAEQITDADVAAVIAGGPADVMLTHDAPEPLVPAVQNIVYRNPYGWPQASLDYATEGRDRLSRAFKVVKPRLLVHGHHHVHDRARIWLDGALWATDIVALAADEMPRSAAVLDLSGGVESMVVSTF